MRLTKVTLQSMLSEVVIVKHHQAHAAYYGKKIDGSCNKKMKTNIASCIDTFHLLPPELHSLNLGQPFFQFLLQEIPINSVHIVHLSLDHSNTPFSSSAAHSDR